MSTAQFDRMCMVAAILLLLAVGIWFTMGAPVPR